MNYIAVTCKINGEIVFSFRKLLTDIRLFLCDFNSMNSGTW